MLHKTLEDVILLLMKGSIFIEGPVSLLPSVYALSKLIFGSSSHMIYVDCTNLVNINELVIHISVTIFLSWIQIRPYICPL